MGKILVVEDDKNLNRTVCTYLKTNGFDTVGVTNGMEAIDAVYENRYDLIISDIMMPEIDGFELAKTIRETNADIPILFMTARDDFEAKQKGFRAGIDDYVVKPVHLQELELHIGALLRRAGIAQNKKLVLGTFSMDLEQRTAIVSGQEIALTQREFDILFQLLSYPKKTFTRSQLMEDFWDMESEATPRAVDIYITKLRDKLSSCDEFEIVTVRGLGYKAVPKEEQKIELETQIQDDIQVKGDPDLLAIVWNNLLSNAFKFTNAGGIVSVAVWKEGSGVWVTVSDTGYGMDETTKKHIFEKFYQGDRSHLTVGNGLGLSLVRRVLDVVHGEITVESNLGKGSKFLVYLPQESEEIMHNV